MSAVVEAAKAGARWAQITLNAPVTGFDIDAAFPAEKSGLGMRLFVSDDSTSWVVILSGGVAKWVPG